MLKESLSLLARPSSQELQSLPNLLIADIRMVEFLTMCVRRDREREEYELAGMLNECLDETQHFVREQVHCRLDWIVEQLELEA